MISSWIWERLKPALPELSWVTVYETATCGAHFDGSHYRIWKELTLDSALRLSARPDGDPRRRIHGHTYTLRLHLHAPLDQVMGWTIDFGDVKEMFAPIFRRSTTDRCTNCRASRTPTRRAWPAGSGRGARRAAATRPDRPVSRRAAAARSCCRGAS